MRDSEKIERAVALLEELTAEHQVPDYQQLLALCYAERHRFVRHEDHDQAEQALAKAVSLLEDLVARYPQNPDYRFTLSTIYSTGLREFGPPPSKEDLADIEARSLTALKLLDELHNDHPGVPDYVLSQLGLRRGLGMLFNRVGRFEDAQPHFQEAIRLYDSLHLSETSDIGGLMRATFTRQWYADMLLGHYRKVKAAGGEPRREWLLEARQQLQTCVDKMQPFADADPRHSGFVGYPYKRLVAVNIELGDDEAAATAAQAMKKYLPPEKWNDPDRDEQRRPPSGGRRVPR